MKHRFVLLVSLIIFVFGAPAARAEADFGDTQRFIFYAVLEGCYEDGISTADVSQILLHQSGGGYSHFIYACPICTPVIHALEVYRSRPPHFFGLKTSKSTFGPGLADDLKTQLYSEKAEERLTAINALMQRWISRRITLLRLTDQERKELQSKLEEMRKKGMSMLEGMEKDPAKFKMSAFATVRQCAVCNGACCLKLKPDAGK